MKNLIIFLFVVLVSIASNKSSAQDKEKSNTKSALCTAQGEIVKMVFNRAFNVEDKIDIKKVYRDSITRIIAACMAIDIQLWGKMVLDDIDNGKIKNRGLSFEQPDDKSWPVPIKAQKKYLKGFDKAKKDFLIQRKKKTLSQTLDQKNVKKYILKTAKVYMKKNKKMIKKITHKTRFRWLRS